VPGGVVNVCWTGGGFPPPPPQPVRAISGMQANSTIQARTRYETRRRVASTRATGARNANPILASFIPSNVSEAVLTTCVLTVTVNVAFAVEDRLSDDGETLHVALSGTPLQLSVAVPAAPGVAAIDKLYVAVWPAVTVAVVAPPLAGVMARVGVVPAPPSAINASPLIASSTIVNSPVRAPAAVGLKVIRTLQDALGATLAEQVFVAAKSPVVVML